MERTTVVENALPKTWNNKNTEDNLGYFFIHFIARLLGIHSSTLKKNAN